jgi:flagellar basal body-associated protein FliL
MLWTICMVLIVLWLLGVVTAYTMGGKYCSPGFFQQ